MVEQQSNRPAMRLVKGLYLAPPKEFHIGCPRPGCTFVAIADREGMAVRILGNHLVQVHVPQSQQQGVA